MPLAALAVHQGRYYLAFGADTPARLLRDGHSYLGSVVPFVVLSAALALGVLAGRLARAWQGVGAGGRSAVATPHPRSTLRIWALISVLLLVLYCAQELTEGALTQTRLLANNPRKLTREDIMQIYLNAAVRPRTAGDHANDLMLARH